MSENYLYLVRYIECYSNEEDFVVIKSKSLSKLFDEIVDLLGDGDCLLSIERIYVTDLDVREV